MTSYVLNGIPVEILKREAIERHVESLIELLDELDGNVADLEPANDEEPSLGWPEGLVCRTYGGTEDLEDERADDEPWLGSPEAQPTCATVARVSAVPVSGPFKWPDWPLDPDAIRDPSSSQLGWGRGSRSDLEAAAE